MKIIPPVNPLLYVLALLAFVLLVLTLIALLRSNERTRRVKALFFGGACYLQLVTIAYPIWLYSNKPAPLSSAGASLLIGFGRNGSMVALNARDGSVRWTHPLPGTWVWTLVTAGPGKLFYTASQTTDGGTVLTANRASDDTQVWQTALLRQHSYGKLEQLMTANGFVYVDVAMGVSDEVVYALRANDGSLAWKHTAHFPNQLDDSLKPFLITAGNGLVFVRAQDGGFSALHANDSSLVWHFSLHLPPGRSVFASQLVLAGQNVYSLQSISGSSISSNPDVSLLALSQGNGKPVWQKHMQGSNYATGLAGSGAHLYLSINGQTILLNALDGTQLWQRSLNSGYTLAVTEARGIVYIPGESALNALDERTGKILWSLPAAPDGDFTVPVLSQNVLFTSAQAIAPHLFSPGSGQDAVVALNPSNGSVYWSTTSTTDLVGIFNRS
jgi:outer membrane protein assembly factor BamB